MGALLDVPFSISWRVVFRETAAGCPQVHITRVCAVGLAASADGQRAIRAGLALLGFKPRACLKPWHTWRQSSFVYPDERSLPGSTTAFIALHDAMLHTDRVALCTYVRSRNTEPRLVALAAAQELRDEYGDQARPHAGHYASSAPAPDCPRSHCSTSSVNLTKVSLLRLPKAK